MARRVGRPYIYDPENGGVEEMQKRIDAYFKECDGKLLTEPDGTPILTKWGQEIYIGKKPYTITGLALAIGFNSRQALLNYQGREEFNDTITRAKAKVEAYAESRLYDKDGGSGAQFSLRNNFKGWNGDQENNTEALDRLDEVLSKLGGVI
ncbi:MAG: terminase small subunit [Prevotellaceae bacterium]|nr:terminase small subunit [Prevotellaceae bacterium]